MNEFFIAYFVSNGLGWAIAGAIICVMFGGWGSARGLRIAGAQTAGVLAEKPELFGKLLALTALPGTQGFYGFVMAILIATWTDLLAGKPNVSPGMGFACFFIGIGVGIVQYRSAIFQGETSAASINLVSRRPEEFGRSIILPALVETYALVALLGGIILLYFLRNAAAAASVAG